MIKNYDLKGGNIKDDHLINMVNNGDIEYNVSPSIVFHNLFEDDPYKLVKTPTNQLNNYDPIGLKAEMRKQMTNEVKEFEEPVDYDTAFGEYYPDAEKTTEEAVHSRKS